MGGILFALQMALAPVFDISRLMATVLLIAVGIISYFGIGQGIGALNLRDIKSSMKRGG